MQPEPVKILFVCIHNSGRSQMAESFLNLFSKDRFIAESAGLEPKEINPLVIEVMKEVGIDISKKKTNSVFDFFKQGKLYSYVITVCDDTTEKQCPIFPGIRKRLHWPFKDPASLEGNLDEKISQMRQIRDAIKEKIEDWINSEQKK